MEAAPGSEQTKRKRVRKEIQKRRLIKKETPPASDDEVENIVTGVQAENSTLSHRFAM